MIDLERVYCRVVKGKGKKVFTYQGFFECPHCGQYVVVIDPDTSFPTYGAAQEAASKALADYKARAVAEQNGEDGTAKKPAAAKK